MSKIITIFAVAAFGFVGMAWAGWPCTAGETSTDASHMMAKR